MSETKPNPLEAEREIREQYEFALLNDRQDLIQKIETDYRGTSLWKSLEKTRKEIEDVIIA